MKKPLQVQLEEEDRDYFNEMNARNKIASSKVLRKFILRKIAEDKRLSASDVPA